MARTTATNFSGALDFSYATTATDLFKKEDVQTLAVAVDAHDHSAGKGLTIAPAAGSIAGSAIADGSITSAKIADGTITSTDIADGTIATADIALGAVTASVVQGAFLNPTTTSTSPVAVPGLTTPSLTCVGARPVVVTVSTSIQFGSITQNANLFLARDGVSIGCLAIGASAAASEMKTMAFTYLDLSVVVGSHTWGLMWSTSAGTISMVGAAFSSITATELRV